MSNFPLDVLVEILCRLPVDNLLRLRCVSKSWCALIDSPDFAKLYLSHSLKTNSSIEVIIKEVDCDGYGNGCFYSLSFDSVLNSRLVIPKELHNPLLSCGRKTDILGSCNGLLLISNTDEDIALWNPSTGKYNKLPVLEIVENTLDVKFGFGYDTMNDDYKVVRIAQYSGSEKGSFRSDVNIFSLRKNSWRGAEGFPYYIRYHHQPGTYLNGAMHWVASTEMPTPGKLLEPKIVAFDLGTEKCRVVPRPPYIDNGFHVKLVVLGGSLCTYRRYYVDPYYDWWHADLALDHEDLWEMKKYGVKDSWTRIMSLHKPDKNKYTGNTVVPLAYSKSREEVLVEQDNRRFVWTSVKDDFIKTVDTEIGALRGFLHFNSYVYLESLVQLSSSDDTSAMQKQDNQDEGGKRKAGKKRA